MRSTRIIMMAAVFTGAAFIYACGDSDDPTPPVAKKTVTISGAVGSGRVTSTANGIDCVIANGVASGTCSAAFDSGSVASLTATAATDQEFVAWSGDCTGSAACTITLTRDATVAPRFVANRATLTLTLTTPNADDGGIRFAVSGPSILAVTPAAGVDLIETRTTVGAITTSTILARGTLANGALGTLSVRGVHADSPYTVEVTEAAARASGGYVQRTNLTGYRIQTQK